MNLKEHLEDFYGLKEDELLNHIEALYSTNKIKLSDMYEITNALRIDVKKWLITWHQYGWY